MFCLSLSNSSQKENLVPLSTETELRRQLADTEIIEGVRLPDRNSPI